MCIYQCVSVDVRVGRCGSDSRCILRVCVCVGLCMLMWVNVW